MYGGKHDEDTTNPAVVPTHTVILTKLPMSGDFGKPRVH
jgi:hypothetical protein